MVASTTFSQHKLKTFRGSGQAKNKWITHIQQNQLCYAEKSPTVYIKNFYNTANDMDILGRLSSHNVFNSQKIDVAVNHHDVMWQSTGGNDG